MGISQENIEALAPHLRGGVFIGYHYSVGQQSPPIHEPSPEPDMDAGVKAAVKAAATGTEQAWLDAHPPHIKTWLQQQSPARRAMMKLGSQFA